jgi:hypothetical protein
VADLFDIVMGEHEKRQGMSNAEHSQKSSLLEKARDVAERLALADPNRLCNADDVGVAMQDMGITGSLGPAAGSLFKGKKWEFTGQRIRSRRTSNHAREIKVWRLK